MQVWVDPFNVVQSDGFAQQLLVERQGEASIQVVTMKDGYANDAPNKVEV